LQKWFTTMSQKVKAKIVKDVTQLVLARRTKMCNVLEYKGAAFNVIYTFPFCQSNLSFRAFVVELALVLFVSQIPRSSTGDTRLSSSSVGFPQETTNS
jgi:hypothetical protein